MQKLLTSVAASAALALFVSSAQAECSFHNKQVTASNATQEEGVAMSTYDGPTTAEQTAQKECASGDKNCVPASE